jgi:hypothetical protein
MALVNFACSIDSCVGLAFAHSHAACSSLVFAHRVHSRSALGSPAQAHPMLQPCPEAGGQPLRTLLHLAGNCGQKRACCKCELQLKGSGLLVWFVAACLGSLAGAVRRDGKHAIMRVLLGMSCARLHQTRFRFQQFEKDITTTSACRSMRRGPHLNKVWGAHWERGHVLVDAMVAALGQVILCKNLQPYLHLV